MTAGLHLAQLKTNPAGLAPVMMMPGVVDDHVFQAETHPVPAALAGSWAQSVEARAGLMAAIEGLPMGGSQDQFSGQVAGGLALATAGVDAAEHVLMS